MEDQSDIRGHLQSFGGVRATVIHQQEIKAGWMRFGELLQKQLHLIGRERWQEQEKVLATGWCNAAIHPTVVVVMLDDSNRFDAPSGNPSPSDGVQPEPTFILGTIEK